MSCYLHMYPFIYLYINLFLNYSTLHCIFSKQGTSLDFGYIGLEWEGQLRGSLPGLSVLGLSRRVSVATDFLAHAPPLVVVVRSVTIFLLLQHRPNAELQVSIMIPKLQH